MSAGFRSLIAQRIGACRRGVEFGPSFNPIAPKSAGFNSIVVDHLPREGLIAKYRGQSVDTSRIEDVDVVWDGRVPLPGVERGSCDYVIASHVLEHLPDPVRFLQMCDDLLSPSGALYLLVPDKRYCFDHYRPVSTTGQLLEAFYEARIRPSGAQVFDHYALAAALNGAIAWRPGASGAPEPIHRLDEAYASAREVWEAHSYQDVHCWVFTPAAFRLVMSDLGRLGLTRLAESDFADTSGDEFFVSLARGNGAGDAEPRMSFVRDPTSGFATGDGRDGGRERLRRPLIEKIFDKLSGGRFWRDTRPIRAFLRRAPGFSNAFEWLARAVGRR